MTDLALFALNAAGVSLTLHGLLSLVALARPLFAPVPPGSEG